MQTILFSIVLSGNDVKYILLIIVCFLLCLVHLECYDTPRVTAEIFVFYSQSKIIHFLNKYCDLKQRACVLLFLSDRFIAKSKLATSFIPGLSIIAQIVTQCNIHCIASFLHRRYEFLYHRSLLHCLSICISVAF